jgi:replication factor C subunit 3/5
MSQGDMRRALNILQVKFYFSTIHSSQILSNSVPQSCHAAYEVTNGTNVYLCTGNPLPEDIQRIIEWMMGDEISNAYQSKFLTIDEFQRQS